MLAGDSMVGFPEWVNAGGARRRALAFMGVLGVLALGSASWLYASYNGAALAAGREPILSFVDALGTGALDWGTWMPFLPAAVRVARALPLARERIVCALGGYALAAVLFSLAQLALFACASVAVRRMLYQQDPAWTLSEIAQAALVAAFGAKFKTGILVCFVVFAGVNALDAWRELCARVRERARPGELAPRDDGPLGAAAGSAETSAPAAESGPAEPSAAPAASADEPAPGAAGPPPAPASFPGFAAPLTAEPDAERMVARAGGRVAFLRFDEIDWIEAAGNYLRIHARGRVHLSRGTLRSFLDGARERGFVRVHRSVLVRAASIAAMSAAGSGDLALELRDGTRVRASRRYRAALAELGVNARPARRAPP
jgi:hypothetical protein